jgi:hypothetical protein
VGAVLGQRYQMVLFENLEDLAVLPPVIPRAAGRKRRRCGVDGAESGRGKT